MIDGVTIYFIRHGETDWNRARRYQGQANIPLNDKGREQARRNGRELRTLLPAIAEAKFVSSPLDRTLETMRIVRTELGLAPGEFEIDPRLIELNYGHWEGQLASDLAIHDTANVAARSAQPFTWRPRGGENYADLSQRLESWLEGVERDCVVVSHGGVSRALRGLLIPGVDRQDIHQLDVPQDRVLLLQQGRMGWI